MLECCCLCKTKADFLGVSRPRPLMRCGMLTSSGAMSLRTVHCLHSFCGCGVSKDVH
jgi:hypothetical protein